MSDRRASETIPSLTVPIGRWAAAAAPGLVRTLLGSCVAVVLYDRAAKVGGLAHVVLPDSRGRGDEPGKYADTAVPALVADLGRLRGRPGPSRLLATLVGGARMFKHNSAADIGGQNAEAAGRVLERLGIRVVARDLGGETGRHVTLDLDTGAVRVRVPGGPSRDL